MKAKKGAEKVSWYMQKAKESLQKEVEKYLKLAENEIDKGDFDAAKKFIDKARGIESDGGAAIEEEARRLAEEEVRRTIEEENIRRAREKEELERKELEEAKKREVIDLCLEQAREKLAENDFELARSLANKVLELDGNNGDAQKVLTDAIKFEKEYKAREERSRQEAEERKRKAEEERLKREKIGMYLEEARKSLSENEFGKARSAAEKALELDENSRDTEALLTEIFNAEKEHEQEAERLKKQEEEKKAQAERERVKQEKIKTLLREASEKLKNNDFAAARDLAQEALAVDETSDDAGKILAEINSSERTYLEEKERLKKEEERKKIEAERKKREEVLGYLESADASLRSNKFKMAREFTDKALDVDGENADALAMLDKITDAEEEYNKEQLKEKEKEKERKKQEEEAKKLKAEIPKYLNDAKGRLAENDFNASRKALEEVLKLDEANSDARQLLEEIGSREKKYAEEEKRKKLEAEAAAKRKAKLIAGYLKEAETGFAKKDFQAARSSAEKALAEDKESAVIKRLLEDINAAMEKDSIEKERLKKEEEAKKRAEVEAQKAQKEKAITGYLENARDSLLKNEFNGAKEFVGKALAEDKDDPRAKALAEKIENEEKEYLRREEEARKKEAERLKQEEEAKEREKLIASYLNEAVGLMENEEFDKARASLAKAEKEKSGNPDVKKISDEINTREELFIQEQERIKKENEEKRIKELEEKKKQELVNDYITAAEKELQGGEFSQARDLARKAVQLDAGNKTVTGLMVRIDDEERTYTEKERLKKEEEARKKKEEAERKKAEAEAAAKQKAKRIAEYLKDVEADLKKKDFQAARSSAEKALAEDKESDMIR
ncbi:MAG: hypothetical protein PHW46_00325, partial [Candidatus Omnitrophica bacterium]|nr:hypothetical protein [Candidatus Omnitrophota bacterium]